MSLQNTDVTCSQQPTPDKSDTLLFGIHCYYFCQRLRAKEKEKVVILFSVKWSEHKQKGHFIANMNMHCTCRKKVHIVPCDTSELSVKRILNKSVFSSHAASLSINAWYF